MDKRYQIFISSTYLDLKDERKAAMEAILSLDHFPAGMELFAASDEEQFNYIKQVIDESDYYILILGGKYGSVADDNVSYTEKEYDYAVSKDKPILVFKKLIDDNEPQKNIEVNNFKKQKLDDFSKKAMNNRLIAFWKNKEDLQSKILQALLKQIRMTPKAGWIRGDKINNSIYLEKINKLTEENIKLKDELAMLNAKKTSIEIDKKISESYTNFFEFSIKIYDLNGFNYYIKKIKAKWSLLLIILVDAINDYDENKSVKSNFEEYLLDILNSENKEGFIANRIEINNFDFNTIKYNFIANGDITLENNFVGEEYLAVKKDGLRNSVIQRINLKNFSNYIILLDN